MSTPWRVVIVGGGFGGLRAAQNLKSDSVGVTLVDRRNYHLFQPLLYQVATGALSPGEIASPLRGILSRQKNTRVLLGMVVDVDPDSKCVYLADGAILPYDSLIVATGSQTSFFGHNEWQGWAHGLKSIEEMYLVTFQNRLQVFVQWATQDVTFNRGARLITGIAPTDFNFNREVSRLHSSGDVKPESVTSQRTSQMLL
jgi:NADH dehydrogenase FAD-containing subunit